MIQHFNPTRTKVDSRPRSTDFTATNDQLPPSIHSIPARGLVSFYSRTRIIAGPDRASCFALHASCLVCRVLCAPVHEYCVSSMPTPLKTKVTTFSRRMGRLASSRHRSLPPRYQGTGRWYRSPWPLAVGAAGISDPTWKKQKGSHGSHGC